VSGNLAQRNAAPMSSGSAVRAIPEDQSPAVITMRKSSKLPLVWLVHTSEKRYQTGRIVAGDHKSGHENNTPACELVGLSTDGVDIMKIMISAPDELPDAVAAVEPVTEVVTQAPVLITEQEVVCSTAAAVRVRPAKTRRGLIAILRGIFVNSTANAEKPRRHYPPRRNSFLEHAAMAREMHRL
jgi:hypothetical protein